MERYALQALVLELQKVAEECGDGREEGCGSGDLPTNHGRTEPTRYCQRCKPTDLVTHELAEPGAEVSVSCLFLVVSQQHP